MSIQDSGSFLLEKIMKCVFLIFSANLLTFNQSTVLFKSLATTSCNCLMFDPLAIKKVSSASTRAQHLYHPTLAREFQGFRVWGKFVFRTLELTDTPTNLANQVKLGHALDQSRSVRSRGPERAHENNEPSWRSSRADRLSRQFWDD